MATYAETISEFAHNLKYEDIPDSVVEDMKLRILDIIGICLATSQMDYATIISKTARNMSPDGSCTAICNNGGWSPYAAALINGSLAHGVDFDDTHIESITHPSSVIVPAGLAAGEGHQASGRDILTAMIAGFESFIRMGLVAPLRFHEKGFQTTAACGPYATALVAGRIAGLDVKWLADALGQCGSFQSGIRAFSDDGSWSKRLFSGWAVHNGLLAVDLASHGYLGPHAVFESRWGLYSAYVGLDNCDLSQLTSELGTRWEIPSTSYKPYPASHGQHSFIDCVLQIKKNHHLKPEDIEDIELLLSPEAARWWMNPREVKIAPPTPYAACFSLPFSVSCPIVSGKMGLAEYTDEMIQNPLVLSLMSKVRATDDPSSEFPRTMPGWVKIRTKQGETFEHRQLVQRGGKENPIPSQELEEKFFTNATFTIKREKAEQICKLVSKFEDLENIGELMALLR